MCNSGALQEFVSEEKRLREELQRMEALRQEEPAMCWTEVLPFLRDPAPDPTAPGCPGANCP